MDAGASVIIAPLNVSRAVAVAFSAVTSVVIAVASVIRTVVCAIVASVSEFCAVVSVADYGASARLSLTFEPRSDFFAGFRFANQLVKPL